jgi:hypothetical protein
LILNRRELATRAQRIVERMHRARRHAILTDNQSGFDFSST